MVFLITKKAISQAKAKINEKGNEQMKKQYGKDEIISVIDRRIKEEMQRKNEYIAKNGYKHIDVLKGFDASIATLTSLYSAF